MRCPQPDLDNLAPMLVPLPQVHKGSTMPRKLRYVAGLRGAPERAKMRVVSLELDIGQTHQY